MDQTTTLDTLTTMFAGVDGANKHFDVAISRARTVDNDGTPPTDPAWTPSFDEWVAAAEVAELLHITNAMTPKQTLAQVESEGSKFVFGDAVSDWRVVAASLRSRSTLLVPYGGFGMIDVGPAGTPFTARSEYGTPSW